MTIQDILANLDPETVLEDGNGNQTDVDTLLDSGASVLDENATQEGNEIFLTTESGDIYTAADPAYTIVK